MSPRRSLRVWLIAALLAASAPRAAAQAPLVDLLSSPSSQLDSPADEFVRERVRVDVAPLREPVFAGQPIEIAVRVWLEREFVGQHLQQLSARRLDLPVQVLCPWLERDVSSTGVDAVTLTVAVGDRAVSALRLPERDFDQRTWRGFELRARLAPRAAGELVLDAPRVRLVYATQFRSTLLDEREPTDSRIAGLVGPTCELTVATLPDQNRPLEFGGAIGQFELAARTDRDELKVGEVFRLEVRISGQGNFGEFDPPRLASSNDFRVVGQLAQRVESGLSITYDINALSRRLIQTPTVTLSYFDPNSGEYRTARTEPIALRVLSGPAGAATDAAPREPRGMAARTSMLILIAGLLALLAVAVGVIWAVLRGRRTGAE